MGVREVWPDNGVKYVKKIFGYRYYFIGSLLDFLGVLNNICCFHGRSADIYAYYIVEIG